MPPTFPDRSRVLREDQVLPIFRVLRKPTTNAPIKQRLRSRLFQAFTRFAHKVALKTIHDEAMLDACGGFGVAYEALMVAIDSFDPERGIKFPTYSGKVIQRALRTECRKVLAWRRRSVPLEAPADNDELDPGATTSEHANATVNPWEDLADAMTRVDAVDFLLSKVRLTKDEKVLIMDFMEHRGNLAEIARKWGRTRARVQQVWASLQRKVRAKLQAHFENDLDSIPRI